MDVYALAGDFWREVSYSVNTRVCPLSNPGFRLLEVAEKKTVRPARLVQQMPVSFSR